MPSHYAFIKQIVSIKDGIVVTQEQALPVAAKLLAVNDWQAQRAARLVLETINYTYTEANLHSCSLYFNLFSQPPM